MTRRTLVAPPSARGTRLDVFLAADDSLGLTRARLSALITQGHVTCDGAPCKPGQRLKGGERLEVAVPAVVPAAPQPEELPLTTLYEDAHLIVVDKAPGVVVHPGAGHASGTLVNALLHHVSDLSGVGGEARPGLVHRLDKDTSGVMVVAKHDRALVALQAAFKAREVDKRYLALVVGAGPAGDVTLSTLYGRHPRHRLRFTGRVATGKPAVTHLHPLERFDGVALLEARLETGRTHQIRVHCAEAGYPLVGDALYGPKAAQRPELIARQALHAASLAFAHPITRKALRFVAPPPPDFALALARLRGAEAKPKGRAR